jgi:hypothetical protein
LESVNAMSVDKLDAVSVIYWLIHRGSLALLSALAKRYKIVDEKYNRTAVGEKQATLSANIISPQSVLPLSTRPTH